MIAERKIQESTAKLNGDLKRGKKNAEVLLQNLGGKWFAFWDLNGEIYYQVSPVPIKKLT